MKNKKGLLIYNSSELIQLMEIYCAEYCHRDDAYWRHIKTYFFAILIIDIIPFANIFGIDFKVNLPNYIFPVIGMILTVFFYVIGKGFEVRLKAASESYNNLILMLPKKFRRKSIHKYSNDALYNYPLSSIILKIMTGLLVIISAVLLYIIA